MKHVLFLHGFTGAPGSWRAVRDLAQLPYEALCPYLTGHGQPYATVANDGSPNSFEQEADRLAGLCQADVHFRQAKVRVVCGYSLGSRLGLAMLARHPHLFTQGVLIGVHPGLASDQERLARQRHDDDLARRLKAEGLEKFLEYWQRLPIFGTQAKLPDAVLKTQRQIRQSHSASGLAHSLRTCGLSQMPNYLPLLSAISASVCLIVGAHDRKFIALAQQMRQGLKHGQLDIVPDCGHNVALEAPAAVAARLDRDLA